MAGCAFEPGIAIERQEPDRERFRGDADIAFAENDPIFRSGWFERPEVNESLSQIFGRAAGLITLRSETQASASRSLRTG
jgi:hypothetical protein